MARYDPIITRILKQVMEEEGLSKYQIEDVYLSIFKGAKTFIQLPSCPRVFLANFGKFLVPVKKINRSIYRTLERYRSGGISREEAVERISYFWPVRKRLLEELYSRKHTTDRKRSTYSMAERCKPWDKEAFIKRQLQKNYGQNYHSPESNTRDAEDRSFETRRDSEKEG